MKKRVVVVTPLYRSELTHEERISLQQLREHLSAFDRVIIAPEGLSVEGFDDFQIHRFPKRFFRGISGYNKLMLTRRFYRRFRDYEFMLVYQLDALVFSSGLLKWCDEPWDFIGAPVFHQEVGSDVNLTCLNGGLSLRRIQAFLQVLEAQSPKRIAMICRETPFMERNFATRVLKWMLVTIHQLGLANILPLLVHRNTCHEDVVWTKFAPLFNPQFRVAPASMARQFAFEQEPTHLYELNSRQLPFGCHAWTRWDKNFWLQFLR